ncbi:MAG: ACP S-malonyltransferase [Anaerolineae bacterium]|nr:ACP S-malonyltransferase [Anaerolineae bacterium]
MAIDWSATAFVFPGQGSQVVGMGRNLIEAYAEARAVYDQADQIMGFSLSDTILDGPEEKLNETAITQPAVFVNSVAILKTLQTLLPDVKPAAVAGHSLGELTALVAAGSLDFADGLKLVKERGRLMGEAGDKNPGAMSAILGLEATEILNLCQQVTSELNKVVVLANDNCPGQIVVSGDPIALEELNKRATDNGAKRVIPLAVSVATHSPLMQPAQTEFKTHLQAIQFAVPQIPVYANLSAEPLTSLEAINTELEGQLTGAVQWTRSIQNMIAAGINTFVEVGPQSVLTGLIRRIDRDAVRINISDVASLQAFVSGVAE